MKLQESNRIDMYELLDSEAWQELLKSVLEFILEPIGCVCMKLDFPNYSTNHEDPNIASLGMLSVKEEYTEMGLASGLIEYSERKAKRAGYQKMRLQLLSP